MLAGVDFYGKSKENHRIPLYCVVVNSLRFVVVQLGKGFERLGSDGGDHKERGSREE